MIPHFLPYAINCPRLTLILNMTQSEKLQITAEITKRLYTTHVRLYTTHVRHRPYWSLHSGTMPVQSGAGYSTLLTNWPLPGQFAACMAMLFSNIRIYKPRQNKKFPQLSRPKYRSLDTSDTKWFDQLLHMFSHQFKIPALFSGFTCQCVHAIHYKTTPLRNQMNYESPYCVLWKPVVTT